jgi:oxygen-independent coproporphyrinogen-3 oxidase
LRWANERDAAKYSDLIETSGNAVTETTELDENDVRSESLFLGLRLLRGVDLNEYRDRFHRDIRDDYREDLARLTDAGLIELSDDWLKLTRHGALLSNEVFSTFI